MFFVAHVEVCINVGGGRNGRVPEEFGHLNQFGSIAEKDPCEGMAKIVEIHHDLGDVKESCRQREGADHTGEDGAILNGSRGLTDGI